MMVKIVVKLTFTIRACDWTTSREDDVIGEDEYDEEYDDSQQ